MNTDKARDVTNTHIQRVCELIFDFMALLRDRAAQHDASKLLPVELEPLQRMQDLIDRYGQAHYDSAEYKLRTALIGPMLDHHYAHNSHHPEHHANGVDGMDLLDVVEMFFDWKAASERDDEPAMHITAACERFDVSPQLTRIFRNTADHMGFKHQ